MAKDKKLLVFIPSIEDGGVEKNLYLISNFLTNKIKEITLITYDQSKKKKINKKIKIRNPVFNFSFLKGRYPKYFLCLILLIKTFLINRNYVVLSFQANIYVIILCKLFGIKVISRSNSSSMGWSKNFLKQFIFSYYFKRADRIIVNSYDFKKEMDKRYKIKTYCILNPFKFLNIKKSSNEKAEKIFSQNVLKIISVGRLTLQKDFLTLLQAIKHVKKKKIELVILGKGSEYSNLLNYIDRNNLDDKVRLIGYKKNPFKYIKQSQIFILTSIFEGSPNVLIEAQYLNKYIISTNCPTGPREILNNGQYGSLVKMGDYKSIAKILQNFNYNLSIKKKIKLGFINTKKYDHKINSNKYLNLIQKYI